MSEIDIIESCDSDGSHHSTESSQLSTKSTKFKTSDHFKAFENKLKCNYCGKVFSGKSGSSTLKRHLNNAHNKFGPKTMKITDMFQKGKESEKLDPNEELISFLVCGDHPFNTVEEPAFNSFISSLILHIKCLLVSQLSEKLIQNLITTKRNLKIICKKLEVKYRLQLICVLQ